MKTQSIEYSDLETWKSAKELAIQVYRQTMSFPQEEKFGLTNQIRRAVVSIVSNISEGCGRETSKETIRFLYIARGSLYEVEAQLLLAIELGMMDENVFKQTLQQKLLRNKQLINGFINYYKKRI